MVKQFLYAVMILVVNQQIFAMQAPLIEHFEWGKIQVITCPSFFIKENAGLFFMHKLRILGKFSF